MTGRSIRWWRWHPVRCAHPAGHKTARGNKVALVRPRTGHTWRVRYRAGELR